MPQQTGRLGPSCEVWTFAVNSNKLPSYYYVVEVRAQVQEIEYDGYKDNIIIMGETEYLKRVDEGIVYTAVMIKSDRTMRKKAKVIRVKEGGGSAFARSTPNKTTLDNIGELPGF